MIFLSAESNILYSFRPSRYDMRETALGPVPVSIPGIKVQFESTGKPIDAAHLPWCRKEARGMCDTSLEAARLSRMTGEDISEETLNKLLMAHRSYGIKIVAINQEASRVIESDEDADIVPMGKGFYCRVCDAHLKQVGSHARSNVHKQHLKKRQETAKAELSALVTRPTREAPDAVAAALASYD